MTALKLQPGDYIPTSEMPADKRQAVIDAFVAAGARVYEDDPIKPAWFDEFYYIGWHSNGFLFVWETYKSPERKRRVTLEQILGEQIAENANCFETRKHGDYVTHDQMEREAEHWQRVGPELLAALEYVQSNVYIDEGYGKFNLTSDFDTEIIDEAITKARSIK